MKTANATKKLEKNGFEISTTEKGQIIAKRGEYQVAFWSQDDAITCISTSDAYDRKTRDIMTDYFPETYHDNIKRAIDFIDAMEQRKQRA